MMGRSAAVGSGASDSRSLLGVCERIRWKIPYSQFYKWNALLLEKVGLEPSSTSSDQDATTLDGTNHCCSSRPARSSDQDAATLDGTNYCCRRELPLPTRTKPCYVGKEVGQAFQPDPLEKVRLESVTDLSFFFANAIRLESGI